LSTEQFRQSLLTHFNEFHRTLATDSGDWVVKGFIDVYRNIYTISVDTKVVSKIIELMLFPVISRFATEHGYKMVLSEYQNHYPDISFIAPDGTKVALDLKSTYRTSIETVNGFTLGAFNDYWMNYLTEDMAQAIDSDVPYHNLEGYWKWRERGGPKR
jgi:hypothetical protein